MKFYRSCGSLAAFPIAALFGGIACSSTTASSPSGDSPPAFPTPKLAVACADAPDAIYGDPGPLPSDLAKRGEILKCTTDPHLTKESLQATASELGYVGKPFTSGAHVYRIAYRT